MVDYDLSDLAVLIVDDNAHMRTILRTILRAFGIRRIIDVGNAFLALEELKSSNIDLILLDYVMDEIDGIEFANLIRRSKDSGNVTVPIIMISGYTELSKIQRSREAGIDEFLSKPISADKLYRRISRLLTNPRVFVRSGNGFVGPDRRRKALPVPLEDERRINAPKVIERL